MFEVGQKVWDVVVGEGVVRLINNDFKYPVVVAFNDGSDRTYKTDGKSVSTNEKPSLYPYPVEVTKKVTKPSINWEHVHSKYNYLAADVMGNTWLYEKEPTIDDDDGYWDGGLGEIALADTHASYAPGTCDWKDSLAARPEGA